MPDRAHITSVQQIEAFRASLIVYSGRARVCVEEVGEEIKRTRDWLLNVQRSQWEKEIRRRGKALDEAEQELFTARLGNLRTETAAQQYAVARARRSLLEAEEKKESVRRWNREFDNRLDPLIKQVEQLHTFLSNDLAKAVAHLGTVLNAIELYTTKQTEPGTPPALESIAGVEQEPGSDQPEDDR
jgi:hypothetical protein